MTLHGAEASSRTYAKNGADCACCHRRAFVKGASAAALATLTSRRNASAQPASPSADKPFRIDVHHHLSSPGFVEAIRSRKTGQIPLENWTPAKSLEDMDKGAVATAMLSISEPSVNFGDDAAARALARETNEYGARLIADHPGRFGMYATVPLPDVEGSLREIAYALDTLRLDGICMMTDYRGKFLGDPSFGPVMEELNRRGAIVYTHPFRNDCCRNLVPDVFEPIIELGTDTTRTIASLMFSGTAAKFPDIKFIFSHAGGTAPYLMQRFTFLFNVRKDLQPRMPQGPAFYMQHFYYDTASASTINPLVSLTRLVPPTQILFGTDFPFLMAAGTAADLRQTGLFDAGALRAIERDNAVRLMPRYRA